MLRAMDRNQPDCNCLGTPRPDRTHSTPGPQGVFDMYSRQGPCVKVPYRVEWLRFGRWYDSWKLSYEDLQVD